MKKQIEINGKEYTFKASAAVPRLYRIKFGRDLFVDMSQLEKKTKNKKDDLGIGDLTIFENVAYIMNKHGDPDQPDDIDEWLEQFETFDIYLILPQIVELWALDTLQTSKVKKENQR